jgi:MptA/FolE2 family GTP cyclohydrolase
VSNRIGFVPYKVTFEGEQKASKAKLFLTVDVPYTSVCPCSKEISKYGAHVQRSVASIKVQLIEMVRIEELIKVVEGCASCEMFSVLKRQDEKFVTETSYENPAFVEDMSRDIATQLDAMLDTKIADYYVVVNHFESIHPHDAVCIITAERELQ